MFARHRFPFAIPPVQPTPPAPPLPAEPADRVTPPRSDWDDGLLHEILIDDADVPTRLSLRDPDGLRVVPLRPDSRWPLRRAGDRVRNPFRAFPYRALYLSRLMYAPDVAP